MTLPEVSVDDTDCRAQIDRLLQDEQISLCTRVGDTLLFSAAEVAEAESYAKEAGGEVEHLS